MRRALSILFAACALLCVARAHAQDDGPSLGDAARQARLQKQQKDAQAAKDAQAPVTPAKDAQSPPAIATQPNVQGKDSTETVQSKAPKHVFTNDEIPEHIGPTSTLKPGQPGQPVSYPQPTSNAQAAGEQWKQQILSMKNYVASLETSISNTEQSVHYAPANCVSGCVEWNLQQEQQQQQVEYMKQQLIQQRKSLEHMQEMARRQGFGSSVWDP